MTEWPQAIYVVNFRKYKFKTEKPGTDLNIAARNLDSRVAAVDLGREFQKL